MELKDILSIAGKPGLYKLVGQMKNGIVVESLIDGKRVPAYSTDRVSALEDISIYSDDEEVLLAVIFDSIFEKENGEKTKSHSGSSDELKAYFSEILPDYDKDRVYVSDMKKVLRWYNLLHEAGMLIQEKPEEEKEEKPEEAKKTTKKKKVAKAAKKEDVKEEEN